MAVDENSVVRAHHLRAYDKRYGQMAKKLEAEIESSKSQTESARQAAESATTAAARADGVADDVQARLDRGDFVGATGEPGQDADIAGAEQAIKAAQSAAKDATDAAARADDAASLLTANVLKGNVKDTFIHVDDAWPSSLLSIEIEGACKQDGTPSPENPVPIVVVENPVLRITGRNLIDVPNGTSSNSLKTLGCGLIPAGKTAYVSMEASSNSSSSDTGSAAAGLFDAESAKSKYSIEPQNIVKGVNRSQITASFDATKHLILWGYKTHSPAFEMSNYQLEIGGHHEYRPYTSQSIPITLPAEHPYLAALPDGTHDEVVIDKDGNASLVARVSEAVIDASRIDNWGYGKIIYKFPEDGKYSTGGTRPGDAVISRVLKGVSAEGIYKGTYVGISVGGSTAHINQCDTCFYIGDGGDVSSIDGASFYYPLMTPVTYQLGKLDIPSLPETISNVWTDAEVTPRTGIEYVRDVNIAFANIEDAIASITQG